MEIFAVIGNPVGHSLSPEIHRGFARQFGIELEYEKLHEDPDRFAEAACRFRDRGGTGLNVTVPFKQQAFEWVDRLSGRARIAGAVNTISFRESRVYGDNTDGAGLVTDIEKNLGFSLAQANILVLGAGGAARGIIGPLLQRKPVRLVIANRTVHRAVKLADRFSGSGGATGCGLDQVPCGAFDFVINATAASLDGELPTVSARLLEKARLAYDLVYASRPTPFLEFARSAGVPQCSDGLGMLVEQAAESFKLWHGQAPDTAPVLNQVNHHLGRGQEHI